HTLPTRPSSELSVAHPAAETQEKYGNAKQIETRREGQRIQTNQNEHRAREEKALETVAVDDRTEDDRPRQNAHAEQRDGRAGRRRLHGKPLDERRQKRTQHRHHDAENEHAKTRRRKDLAAVKVVHRRMSLLLVGRRRREPRADPAAMAPGLPSSC